MEGTQETGGFGEQYVREQVRRAKRQRYEIDAATRPNIANTDWSHPNLAPYMEQINRVRQWRHNPKGLLACGRTGRGKTRSVFDLYRRLACDDGLDVSYYPANDFFGRLQEQVNYGRDDARGWIEAVVDRPIVILDDLGQEALLGAREEWAQSWLFRFFDIRLEKKLPLIVTTNLPPEQLTGDGIRAEPMIRRLLELCEVVKFGGND